MKTGASTRSYIDRNSDTNGASNRESDSNRDRETETKTEREFKIK